MEAGGQRGEGCRCDEVFDGVEMIGVALVGGLLTLVGGQLNIVGAILGSQGMVVF